MSVENTRPITANNRGRVYQCMKCRYNPYQGERSKVMQHFYRKHVAVDEVPYYCTICKFVTMSKTELENHVKEKVYPSHKATVEAMKRNGEVVNEPDSLLQNLRHYIITENDVVRLSKEDSQNIFETRKRKGRGDLIEQALDIADVQVETRSECTENILPQMLGDSCLSPFSLYEDPFHPENRIQTPVIRSGPTVPRKEILEVSKSTPTTSSYSKCAECEKREAENIIIKNDVKLMGAAMAEMVNEMKEMKEMLQELKTEKENRNTKYEHMQERRKTYYSHMYFHKKPYQKSQNYSRHTGTFNLNQPRQNTHIRF